MSVTRAQINLSVLASEEFTAVEAPGAATVSERTLKAGGGNAASLQLNATSTPALTKPPISKEITIAGTITLDLTAIAAAAIPAAATRTVDLTGAKVVAFTLRGKSTNVAAINVAPGSSNPYPMFGTGNDIDVKPGLQISGSFRDVASTMPAVSSTVKNIDISGTNGDVLYLDLLFGT